VNPSLVERRESFAPTAVGRTLAVVFLYFAIAGVATVMLGPALPLLASRWGLPDAQLGTLFVASFTGQCCGAWLAGSRLGLSLLLGSLATALGLLGLAYVGPAAGHFALFCIGVGLGAGLTAGNVITGTIRAGGDRDVAAGRDSSRSRLLALLNFSWGVGAIACPLLLDLCRRLSGYGRARQFVLEPNGGELLFLGLAVAFAGCSGVIAWLLPRSFYEPSNITGVHSRLSGRVLWLFIATLVLYVGVENAMGGWLPTYAQRITSAQASSIALCFWITQLGGRGLTALLVKLIDERILYRGCLLTLTAATGLLFLVPRLTTFEVFTLTAVAALSLGPLFPLAVSFLLGWTGNHPHVGKVFAISSLGGSLVPWLTGVVSTHFRNLRMGFAVSLSAVLLLMVLSTYLPRSFDHADSK
jgi:FHS family glucose/mannose:H+ symporter-like MFS transporter